ncbi:ATP-dependent RNA helicase DDX4-like [Bolinopsis microptera]|uniref:ATP-dependent RNA helicase DDX4-like n=1 Tax=Bolinopsis microptera TaxID=2820187 RepID=UPI00307950A8
MCEDCKTRQTQQKMDGIGEAEIYGKRKECSCFKLVKVLPKTEPIKEFGELNLDKQVQLNIVGKTQCGFKVPTPIQRYALPIIIEGFDVMGCAQTGTGKTAAYLIPMIKFVKDKGFKKKRVGWDEPQKPEVLIIAPTRELAQQIHADAIKLTLNMRPSCGIKVLNGGSVTGTQRDEVRQGCNILIGTPGRIKHFITDHTISLENTKFLVLDEADRMIDDGFRADLEAIVGLTDMPKKEARQTVLFSATFRSDLLELAFTTMRDDFRLIKANDIGSAQPNITQNFELVKEAEDEQQQQQQIESMLKEILMDLHAWNETTFLKCSCWKKERNGFNTTTVSDQPNIKHFLLHVLGKCAKEKILIFVATKLKAKELADSISNHLRSNFKARFMTKQKFKHLYTDGDDQDLIDNYGAISFHANQNQPEREQALSLFDRGVYPILVATNVAARGLDIEGVTYVINADFPLNLSDLKKYHDIDTQALKDGKIKRRPVRNQFEEYIHRIGRTGRAEKEGESISFFREDKDAHLAVPLIRMLAKAQQNVPDWLSKLAAENSSIEMAATGKDVPEKQERILAGLATKEWDESKGPCVDELWGNEP